MPGLQCGQVPPVVSGAPDAQDRAGTALQSSAEATVGGTQMGDVPRDGGCLEQAHKLGKTRRPCFVTPHATRTYAERVAPFARHPALDVAHALARPVFCLVLPGKTLWGCVNRAGLPFLAATDPADENAPFLLVRTVGPWWFWHEARAEWQRLGYVQRGKGKRWQLCYSKTANGKTAMRVPAHG